MLAVLLWAVAGGYRIWNGQDDRRRIQGADAHECISWLEQHLKANYCCVRGVWTHAKGGGRLWLLLHVVEEDFYSSE